MINWDFISRPNDAGGQGVVVMMLSLNLIILSFFLLLNALAKPVDLRVAAAMHSVQSGFDYRQAGNDYGDDDTELEGPVWVPRVGAEVRGQVMNLLPQIDPMLVEVATDEIRVRLPARDVWEEGALKEGAKALLGNLAMLAKDNPDVAMGIRVMGGDDGLRRERVEALQAVATLVPVGWRAEGDGSVFISLRALGVGLPEFAQRAANLVKAQGAAVEAVGKAKDTPHGN